MRGPPRVKILRSPYSDVKRGDRGKILGQKHEGTIYHVYRVDFKDGRSRLFLPSEVKVLG